MMCASIKYIYPVKNKTQNNPTAPGHPKVGGSDDVIFRQVELFPTMYCRDSQSLMGDN
jgi:hypothetical protein